MQIKDIICNIVQNFRSNRIPLEYKDEFKKEVLSINLQREQLYAYVIITYIIFNFLVDMIFYRYKWSEFPAYKNMYFIHIISIFVFTGYIFLCKPNVSKKTNLNKIILHYLSIILFVLFNGSLSLNAQFIHGQISAFIIALFAISALLILNKNESLIIISLSYLSFITALIVIQHDSTKLSGNIVNSLSLAICAFIVSRTNFSMYAKNFLANKVLNDKTLELDTLNGNLEEKNNQLETILESISDGLSIIDKNNNFTFLNQHGKDFFYQYDKISRHGDSFKHTQYFDMQGRELAVENMVSPRVFKGEIVKNFGVMAKRPDKTFYYSISGSPVCEKDGSISSAIISYRDITEQIEIYKLIEDNHEQIIKAEKDKNDALEKSIVMKDEFISLISHEFKTPLTVINSAIQTMELVCKNELSDKSKGFLNKIRQNSNRQMKLVNNLLDITRMNAGHLKVNKKDMDIVDLTRSITESIRIFAEQKSIKVSFSTSLMKKVIGLDEEKYERILLNLLSNAIKFTPGGKSIAVRISQKIVNGKCKVCIQVTDKGIGIPYDKQELIFERFGQVDNSLTRQAEGTGIGLHLVKMLIEMMGGKIALESKVGVGSTFTLLIPAAKEKETPIEQMIKEINDNRLIQATAIEFSDV